MEEFKQIPDQLKRPNPTLASKIFVLYIGTEITRLIYSKRFGEATCFLEDHHSKFKQYEKRVAPIYLLASYYRFAYVYIATGKFTMALKQVNKIVLMNKNLRPDIFRFAKLLSLLIHFELGNVEIIPYLKKSISLYYKRQKEVFKTELLYLKYISKFGKTKSKNEQMIVFEKFKQLLIKALEKDNEDGVLLYFDFRLWVNAKQQVMNMNSFIKLKIK